MDLIQVKKYLQERRAVTLKDVSTHFNQNADTVRPLLDTWVGKGKVKRSGATCGALNNPTFGQVPGLLAEMARDPKGWKDVLSVVLIRIGINSLGKREDL